MRAPGRAFEENSKGLCGASVQAALRFIGLRDICKKCVVDEIVGTH